MSGGGRIIKGLVCGLVAASTLGCASLDDYRRLQAAHRSLKAEKEGIRQDLFDSRSVNDSLRTRATSLDRELAVKDELLANLRGENELLEEMRRTATDSLEQIAGKQTLGHIMLAGPALPASLDSALKRLADHHPGLISYDSNRGTVKWKSDLLFGLGSDVVKDTSRSSLRDFAEVIKSAVAEEFEVIVVGHTDNRPIVRPTTKSKHPTNWHLSAHRAISVSYELAQAGYPTNRIGVMGYGSNRPVADNASESGASQNRRVEIYLIPRGAIVQASAITTRSGEKIASVPLKP